MKIVIAGVDNYSSTNSLGIQAMSDGILRKIACVFPNAKITIHYKTHILAKRDLRLLNYIDGYSFFYKPMLFYLYRKFKRLQSVRFVEIKRADMLIISGDGIIADIFAGWGLTLAFEMMAAIEYHIPCYFVNMSVNVSAKSFMGFVISNYFRQCHISVRENISARLLNDTFRFEHVPVSIDSAFFVEPLNDSEKKLYTTWLAQLQKKLNFEEYIIVGVRGKRPKGQPISAEGWSEVINELEDRFPSKKIIFASTCPGEDLILARQIQSMAKNLIIIDELFDTVKYNYRFLMYLLQGAWLTISDRYHQLILSMLVGTPVIPIEGNTTKTSGLFEMIKYDIQLLPVLKPENLSLFKETILRASENYAHLIASIPNQYQINKFDHYDEILKGEIDSNINAS